MARLRFRVVHATRLLRPRNVAYRSRCHGRRGRDRLIAWGAHLRPLSHVARILGTGNRSRLRGTRNHPRGHGRLRRSGIHTGRRNSRTRGWISRWDRSGRDVGRVVRRHPGPSRLRRSTRLRRRGGLTSGARGRGRQVRTNVRFGLRVERPSWIARQSFLLRGEWHRANWRSDAGNHGPRSDSLRRSRGSRTGIHPQNTVALRSDRRR